MRIGGSLPYPENAAGERLLYQARLDALDGALRPFRTIASGDRPGEACDEVTGTSAFTVHESVEDFRRETPNLAASPARRVYASCSGTVSAFVMNALCSLRT